MSNDDHGFMIFVEKGDGGAARHAGLLIEEGQWHDLGKGWRARSDKPHVTGTQPHTHLYLRGTEVMVVNKDGTPSHGHDVSKMPAKIRQALKTRNLVESASISAGVVIPAAIIASALKAWSHERTVHLALRHLSR